MQSQKLDIVELIEQNPITKLSQNYQGKFIEKIQLNFTETQQRLFIASFLTYLNYNSKTDFVIELESIWKWLGFSRKEHCKVVLEKHFKLEIDYKILSNKTHDETILPKLPENNIDKETRGRKKEKILMTINTFKKLCLKSNTKKADEIHDYFIKLEELTHETITEESIDLKLQLENQKTKFIKDRQEILLDSYHIKCIVYLIKITITKDNIKRILYKFGNTDDINRRLKEHQYDINEKLELIYCIESKNNVQLESELKDYLKTTNFRKEEIFKTNKNKDKKQTELIDIKDITIIQNTLIELNKSIQQDKEHLVIKRLKLEIELEKLKNKNENIKTEENLENEKILEIDEEALEKEEQYINNLDQDTQDGLNIKRTKLQEHLVKRREYNRKRQAGYRQTETYKKYTQTEEFKQKEKERYNKRKLTDEFKQYKKEYYKNNIEQINATKERIRKSKMKTTLVNTDTEKDNFRDWLNLNVDQKTKGNLIWFDLLDKFLGYRTSALISKIYKKYFTDYCIEKYSNINCNFTQFKLDGKNPYGYRNFELIG